MVKPMNQATYYTIRICKPGEGPLDRSLGHHFEYNYADDAEARYRLTDMRRMNPEHRFHLLQTTVAVIDNEPAE